MELARILGAQARYAFVPIADNALWPIENHVPFLLQISFEGGPRETTIGQLEADFTCVCSGLSIESVFRAIRRLTKHFDKFVFDLIDLADFLWVSIGSRTKDKCRGGFNSGSMPVVK